MKISTGFRDLDIALDGGFECPSLVCIGGRPSMGKSALMHNLYINAPLYTKEFYTLDSSPSQIFKRTKGKILTDDVFEMDSLDDLIQEHVPKNRIIFIDYLQLLLLHNANDSYAECSSIMNRLKRLCHEKECTIIFSSQLSRKVEERQGHRPCLTDLRDSGAIEEASDLVIFLLRRDYYDPHDKPGLAEIIIAKNRFGKRSNINLVFKKETMEFDNYVNIQSMLGDDFEPKKFSDFIPKD